MKKYFTTVFFLMATTAYADFPSETAPYKPFDKVDGFKVMSENPNGTKLIKAGVKKGDVVVSVNGRGIASLEDAKKAYDQKDVKEVIVLRNDKPLTLKQGAKQ